MNGFQFQSGGGFTVGGNSLATGTGGVGSSTTLGGVLLDLGQQAAGALISRLAAPAAPAPAAQVPMPRPMGTSTAFQMAQQGPAMPSNGCGCSPKPGTCGSPQYIPQDLTGEFFGLANPCTGNPCYPRATTVQGQAMCAPARKRPRMNPLNPRAAVRATRRLSAMQKQMKRVQSTLKKLAR